MNQKSQCSAFKCDQNLNPRYPCSRCHQKFCTWHLLFIQDKYDSLGITYAQCICCFFKIPRKPDFQDPAISDTLARALVKQTPKFRDRVFAYRLKYEAAEKAQWKQTDFFYGGMQPKPDGVIRAFIRAHRG